MSEITERIAFLTAEIDKKNQRTPVVEKAIAEYTAMISTMDCTKGTKAKKTACNNKKQEALGKLNGYKAELTAIKTSIDSMQKEIATLQAQAEAQGKSQIILAQQGKSLEAMSIEAQGNADAIKTAEAIKAQAVADATTKQAQAQADSSKTMTYVIVAVVVVVVLGVSIMVIKKLKKKK